MSYTKAVFQAMKNDIEYDLKSLCSITKIDSQAIKQCLSLLVKGGVVEQTKSGRFVRDRKYKSRQAQLKGL